MLNRFDQFIKLKKVITSCNNPKQVPMVEGMVRRYHTKYADIQLAVVLKEVLSVLRQDFGLPEYYRIGTLESFHIDHLAIAQMPPCKPPKAK